MKRKVFAILFMFAIILLFCSGITYSMFNSKSILMSNQNIAKFVFNTEKTDKLEIPLLDLNPGETKKYNFAVSNNYQGKTADVMIVYQLTVRTMHFMPLTIKIYKSDGSTEPLMTCDESHSRNSENELVCNLDQMQEMSYSSPVQDEYEMEVIFPTDYNTSEFTDLVDYIDLEINSYQKID